MTEAMDMLKSLRTSLIRISRKIAKLRTSDLPLQLETMRKLMIIADQLNEMIDYNHVSISTLKLLRNALVTISRDVSMMRMAVDLEMQSQLEILKRLTSIINRLDRLLEKLGGNQNE